MWIAACPLLAIVDLAVSLISILLVNWWAPLFATADARLPRWLAWFDTFDADLDTGNRELGWNAGYWGRVKWLNRNPAYGFSYWALGCKFDPSQWTVTRFQQAPLTFIAHSTDGHFNIHAIRFGWRIKLGWKAWNMVDSDAALSAGEIRWREKPWGPAWRVPFVFSISKA